MPRVPNPLPNASPDEDEAGRKVFVPRLRPNPAAVVVVGAPNWKPLVGGAEEKVVAPKPKEGADVAADEAAGAPKEKLVGAAGLKICRNKVMSSNDYNSYFYTHLDKG